MSIYPKVPIQTENRKCLQSQVAAASSSSQGAQTWPHLLDSQAVAPCGWRRQPEGFYSKATTGKLFPGKMGSLCQSSYAPHPSSVLASPASSSQRSPSVSPRCLSSPLAHCHSHSPICLGWFSLHSCQPVSVPPLVASVVSVSSVPRARWSSPFFPSHHCPPLSRRPQESPFASTQHEFPGSPCWDGPTYSPTCRTLSIHLSFSVPFSWAQPG